MREKSIYKHFAYGLLIMRIGLGIMFMIHGFPKLTGGPDKWQAVGESMQNIGVYFAPTFFGMAAAITEFFGGLLLMLGLFFRPSTALLTFVMLIATIHHLASGDGLGGASHAIEAAVAFIGLFLIGPGPYSLDALMKKPGGTNNILAKP